MALPLLETKLVSLNARVASFSIAGDESPRRAATLLESRVDVFDRGDIEEQIEQAYRQIYFHAFKVDREPALESQLRSGQITVRDFIRGLLLSRKFRDDFYRCNSNYRVVEQVVGRVLGRPVHGEQERIAYSILIAERGLRALVDEILDSEEYREVFGYDTVPYQRSRVLPGRSTGTLPFNQQSPRYDAYWREVSARRAPAGRNPWTPGTPRPAWLANQPTPQVRRIWQQVVAAGGFVVTGLVLWTAAAMLRTGGAG